MNVARPYQPVLSGNLPAECKNSVSRATDVASQTRLAPRNCVKLCANAQTGTNHSQVFGYLGAMKLFLFVFSLVCIGPVPPAFSQTWEGLPAQSALMQAAQAADPQISAVYAATSGRPLWHGSEEARQRRAELRTALAEASAHGLAATRYQDIASAVPEPGLPAAQFREIAITRAFLAYARDLSTGVLEPAEVDREIKRTRAAWDPEALVRRIMEEGASAVLADLAPPRPEYARLLRARATLARIADDGAWGTPVPGARYELGDGGEGVAALRARLARMGYGSEEAADPALFGASLQAAVTAFQAAHGLAEDGIAGPVTLGEVNRTARERLGAVLVALERERWLPRDLGARHVFVNITDFRAALVEDGAPLFASRAIVGKNRSTHRTPEFSDVMDHLVINPTWHVPRSIAVKEYLPKLRKNRAAAGHLKLVDRKGRAVDRGRVNFAAYSASSFPFAFKQPPGPRNALGRVKFMFPNPYNIYLHDTPNKALFGRDLRAFSHGCIRLADPFGLAHALLAAQSDDPEALARRTLEGGRETRVNLHAPLPVHLVYRTALAPADGTLAFRRDVYGRDARILAALRAAGVTSVPPES